MTLTDLIIVIAKVVFVMATVLGMIPLLIWWERKGAAYIQDRRGPNRANVLGIRLGGIIHNIADVIKLLFKEDIIPSRTNKFLFVISPLLVLFISIVITAVIPFAAPIQIGDLFIKFQVADLNVGILYILAISSMGVYGVMIGGWASRSSYSLIGGVRSSAQMISYEVALGLSLIGVLLYSGTARLDEIVMFQGANIFDWNFVRQPVAFILFLICLFAETNRNPFDLPEGESELVGGYHTEYSSIKFALFFMAEYVHIAVGSMILVSLFFGGWQIPFFNLIEPNLPQILKYGLPIFSFIAIISGAILSGQTKRSKWGDLRDYEPLLFGLLLACSGILLAGLSFIGLADKINGDILKVFIAILQIATFLIKTLFFCWFFIWVRWTLPRFRYDQLMNLGWKIMVPLALLNILVTSIFIR